MRGPFCTWSFPFLLLCPVVTKSGPNPVPVPGYLGLFRHQNHEPKNLTHFVIATQNGLRHSTVFQKCAH
jgi:hypothetical protein